MSVQEILEDCPFLQEAHIRAALAFAAEREAYSKTLSFFVEKSKKSQFRQINECILAIIVINPAMQAYKFDTRVSENGVISLPFEPNLFNKEVEVIILPKATKKKISSTENAMSDFIEKWSGAFPSMTDEEATKAKHEYLTEKYK
jgi:hypothetical protein